MNCDFKIGDRVKRIGQAYLIGLGELGTVNEVGSGRVYVLWDKHRNGPGHEGAYYYDGSCAHRWLSHYTEPSPKKAKPLTPEQEAIILLAKKHGLRLRRG